MLIAGGSAYFVSRLMTPVYQATATLLVNQSQSPGSIAYYDVLTSERLTKTYRELITKGPVLETVIEDLNLSMTPAELSSVIDVDVVSDTQLLHLSVESPGPTTARQLANATAEAFIATNEQAGLTRSGTVSIVEPAVTPTAPVRPRTLLNSLLGALAGLFIGGVIALVYEYLDDTVKTPDDVERAAGLPTLGGVARFPRVRAEAENLVIASPRRTTAAEAYRVLRTNLQFSTIDIQTIMVSSANPGEGKSTTVANLAVAIAQTGQKVIVVDSDLRRPALHRIFGLGNGAGLTSTLLSSELNLSRFLQPTKFENLAVLTSGPLPPNPSELLCSRRMAATIAALQREADIVLFDSPPTLAVADASVLAAAVDGTLLVVDAGRTRAHALKQAQEALERSKTKILGATLNKLKERGRGYYNYASYYYYGADNTTNGHRSLRMPWARKSPEPEESQSYA
jgi:capsular exopolysaccharide synthesis family protein